jgi:lipopolysaccharide transport system ATP-binding protein
MPNQPILTVENLSKKFCSNLRTSLWYGVRDIAGELLPGRRTNASDLRAAEFWGLQDVSFELKAGESLAIVGANGAGKSTLLKVLNGLLKPDVGAVRIRGRVGALIELGVGLDPVLSGRENIYVRAALLGFTRYEIAPLVDQIIDFTGLHEAIEMPVQFYSSGMTARLAYAVAAHLNPALLLVDEALAVGDYDFQRKCVNHMLGYLRAGGSIILVSHNPHHIQSVCQRGLLLEKGRITFAGTGTETLDRHFEQQVRATTFGDTEQAALTPERPVRITGLTIKPVGASEVHTGATVRVTLRYQALHAIEGAGWGFHVWTSDGLYCITGAVHLEPCTLLAGEHALTCTIRRLALTPGDYGVKAVLLEVASQQPLAMLGWENAPLPLRVRGEVSTQKNFQSMLRQLVTVEVEWQSHSLVSID